MFPQEKLVHVIQEIMAEARKLPVGFNEDRIGIDLPGTRGWGLHIYVCDASDPIVIWERGRMYSQLWLTHFDKMPEYHMKAFLANEAAAISLIKSGDSLLKWIRSASEAYRI